MLSTGSYPQANDMQGPCQQNVDKSVDKIAYDVLNRWTCQCEGEHITTLTEAYRASQRYVCFFTYFLDGL